MSEASFPPAIFSQGSADSDTFVGQKESKGEGKKKKKQKKKKLRKKNRCCL